VSSEEFDSAVVDKWLHPLGDDSAPCGLDLEYDNEFLELNKAAQGKPETQFGPGEPPNWRNVREMSAALLDKTRDLRVALLWVRAVVNLAGFSALPSGLRLLEGLLSNFWEHLHPVPDPDDGDPYARGNALAILPEAEGLLGDLRQSVLFDIRGLGELRLRAIEVGLGQLPPKADENVLTRDQLSQMIASAVTQAPGLYDQVNAALSRLSALTALFNQRFGAANATDLRPLVNLVKGVQGLLPTAGTHVADESGGSAAEGAVVSGAAVGAARLMGNVQSRDDAIRAIDMICEYLDRSEPTNPAQLLLRRARRVINQNFLQLMKELAPEALNEVARVMGVDPESIGLEP
jgi:type VI secretion system protein ImpA